MSSQGSETSEGLVEEGGMTGHRGTTSLRGLLGAPRVPTFGGNPRELKDWLATIRKGQLIYELSEKDTLYLAYNAAEGGVSEFIYNYLMGDAELTWAELEDLLIREFADEATAIEAMRSLMTLAQWKGESPGDLGVRAERLASLAFTNEIRDNAAIQTLLVDLYVEALHNERIRHDAIKEAPTTLSAAIALARDSQKIWEKVRGKGTVAQSREGDRNNGGKRTPTWDRRVKQEVEPEEWEATPGRKGWTLGHGFYRPTPGRRGLVCWTCNYEGHRAVDCPTKWGLPPDHDGPMCTRCGRQGHEKKWCGYRKAPDPNDTKRAHTDTNQGNAGGPPQK